MDSVDSATAANAGLTARVAPATRFAHLRAWIPLAVTAAFLLCLFVFASHLSPDAAMSQPSTIESRAGGERVVHPTERAKDYAWLSAKEREAYEPLAARLIPPSGYTRIKAPVDSFAEWLRYLPVLPTETPVKTGRGEVILEGADPGLAAVIALQPHSDKVLTSVNLMLRLRAEYLWSRRKPLDVAFHFTNGDKFDWRGWAAGQRPRVQGRDVEFRQIARADDSRISYCGYLETLFKYASVHSLLGDTREAIDKAITSGDVLVSTRKQGHALIVLDVATHPEGRLAVLLAQGGRPAQTLHVLRGPLGCGWFPMAADQPLDLGSAGVFHPKQLRHWAN